MEAADSIGGIQQVVPVSQSIGGVLPRVLRSRTDNPSLARLRQNLAIGSNIIEIRYGSNLVNNPDIYFPGANGPLVGFYNDDPTNGYYLSGNPGNPTLTTTPPYPALNGVPPNGTVYRFTPSSSSVHSLQEAGYSVYPNPFRDQLRIDHPIEIQTEQLRLIDMMGRVVSTQAFHSNETIQFPAEKLNAGAYLLALQVNNQRLQSSLLKVE